MDAQDQCPERPVINLILSPGTYCLPENFTIFFFKFSKSLCPFFHTKHSKPNYAEYMMHGKQHKGKHK